MLQIKQNLKDIWFLSKQIDFVLIFLSILFIMFFLDYKLVLATVSAYIYTAFYVLIKRVINGQGVSFLHLFLVFIVGMLLIPGGIYAMLLFYAKGL